MDSAPPPKILSCTNCRQRKIRCDKNSPCVPCQQADIACVFPQRAKNRRPRLGSKARDAQLLLRISQLESIIKSLDPTKLVETSRSPGSDGAGHKPGDFDAAGAELGSGADLGSERARKPSPPPPPRPGPASLAMQRTFQDFIKRQESRMVRMNDGFWTSLHQEFDGIRQLLEAPDDDFSDDADDSMDGTRASSVTSSQRLLLGSPATQLDTGFDIAQFYPSATHRDRLVITFWKNVHPVFRMLHSVTARAHFREWDNFIDPATRRWKFGSLECLTFTIFYAAVTSLDDEQCVAQYGERRSHLLARYRRCAEVAFAQADYLNTMEHIMIQAFVLFLVSVSPVV